MGAVLPSIFSAAGSAHTVAPSAAGANKGLAINADGTAWEMRDLANAALLTSGTIATARLGVNANRSRGRRRTIGRGAVIRQYFFDGSSGDWDAPSVTNCTVAADTEHYVAAGRLDAGNLLRARGLRITPTTGTFGNVFQGVSPTLDLSNAQAIMRFRLHPDDGGGDGLGASAHSISNLQLRLRPFGGTLVTKSAWSGGNTWSKDWLEVGVDVPTLFAGTTLTAIDQMYVTPSWSTGYETTGRYMTMDELTYVQRPTKGRMMIRLDDGWTSHYRAAAIADSLGIPIHVMVVVSNIGAGSNLSWDQFRRIRDMTSRPCILNHCDKVAGLGFSSSTNHGGWRYADAGQTVLTTLADKRDDILRCTDAMEANGVGECSRVVVVPGGRDQRHDIELYKDGTVEHLWYVDTPNVAAGLSGNIWPPPEQMWRTTANHTLDGQTVAQVETMVDNIASQRRFGQVYGHDVSDQVMHAFFTRVAARMADGTLEVVTMRDLLR